MYKKIIHSTALALTLTISPVIRASSDNCGASLKHMVESLKLDSNQKAKIKPILEQLKSTIKNDASQMRDIDEQLSQKIDSGNVDQSSLNGLVDKETNLIGDVMKAKINAKVQILTILNPQQKTELQNKMKKVEEKMKEKYKNCHEE